MAAPIAGVVVHPRGARVTRRGRVRLPAATGGAAVYRVSVHDLPLGLDPDSVRAVAGEPAALVGVDVEYQARAESAGEALDVLRERSRTLRRRLGELADGDDTEQARRAFLDVAARNAASALARAWVSPLADGGGPGGPGGPGGLAAAGQALAVEIDGVHRRRRAMGEERERVELELAAADREIARRENTSSPDARRVVVSLELPAADTAGMGADTATQPSGADNGVEVELELSYRMDGAAWASVYDARVEGERVTLTWYAMVRQNTGEDWPASGLVLSTARATGSRQVPELDPWYVDVRQPPVLYPALPMAAAAPPPPGGAGPYGADDQAEAGQMLGATASSGIARGRAKAKANARQVVAQADVTGPAATYRPAHPVAIPADGSPHRTTVAVIELTAELDYIAAPKLAAETYLRATVTNTSEHTLLPGTASVFHGPEFVGQAALELLAPGAEAELQLGVDDRVSVERKLVRRATGKRLVGNSRGIDVAYRIRAANHAGRPVRLTVLDQLPVPRHESITVRDVQLSPRPAEQTDLGALTWVVELAAGASQDIDLAFRLEHPRGVQLDGWDV
jgi:uncharacterized protein (TIGR02231 family)